MNGYSFTNVQTGDAILATHVTTLNSAATELINQFNTAVTAKLTLFTPTTAAASLNFPSNAEPTTPSAGDVWRAGNALKFQASGGTKTIAFLDSTFTSGLTVDSGLTVTSGAASFAGTASFADAVSLSATNISALTVRKASSGTRIAVFDTSANYLELLNGSSLRVSSTNTPSGNGVFSVAGATGNVTTSGSINATGTLAAGNTTITGTLAVSSAISRGGTAYSTPAKLNLGGFTLTIGNGIDVIAAGVQLPTVVIPYDCVAEFWQLAIPDNTTGTIGITIQRRTSAGANYADVTGLDATVLLLSGVNRAKNDLADIQLNQGDTLRINVASSPTPALVKALSIHLRVRRT